MIHPRTKTVIRLMDKDLPKAKAERVSAHIEKCAKCREKYKVLQQVVAVNTAGRSVPSDFAEGLVKGLKAARWSGEPICAEIKSIVGSVLVARAGEDSKVEGFAGMGLKRGDVLNMAADSLALVELNDGSTLYLNKETEIKFPKSEYSLSLKIGEFFAMMKPQRDLFEIKTPAAVLGVIGTDFDAKVTEKKETVLQVVKGKVSFKNESGSAVVGRRQKVEAAKSVKPVAEKIKETGAIYNWTGPIRPKKAERGWIERKLYLVIAAIVALAVLVGGYLVYQGNFAYEVTSDYKGTERAVTSASVGEASSGEVEAGESSAEVRGVKLASPYKEAGMSWRVNATVQVKGEQKWVDQYETSIRSNIISVDEDSGARVLITIENVKVWKGFSDNEMRLGMIGRQFEYRVSPEGKAYSLSIADGKPIECMEIEFLGNTMDLSNVSGLFQKSVLAEGDEWTGQYEEEIPGYPGSYVRNVERYQFVNYENEGGNQYAVVRKGVTGKIGGNILMRRIIEPKVTHYWYLDELSFGQEWEYRIDVRSGRLVSGSAIGQLTDIKGSLTSVIQGRKVPVKEAIKQESGDLTRGLFTVEYLPSLGGPK